LPVDGYGEANSLPEMRFKVPETKCAWKENVFML